MAPRQKPKTLKQVKAEILDEKYEEVQDQRGVFWLLFRAPGQLILWVKYLFPKKGQVLISARQKGHVVTEIWYSIAFWAILFFMSYQILAG